MPTYKIEAKVSQNLSFLSAVHWDLFSSTCFSSLENTGGDVQIWFTPHWGSAGLILKDAGVELFEEVPRIETKLFNILENY